MSVNNLSGLNAPKKILFHEVSEMQNLNSYQNHCGLMVAEPRNYYITHILVWLGAILYYATTVKVIFNYQLA
jgi:hypothetical protein